MTKIKRILALVCVLALCCGMLFGCKGEEPAASTDATGTGATQNAGVTGQNMNYLVTLTSAGGLPLSGITVLAYADSGLTDLKGYGLTDDKGQVVLSMPAASGYYLDVTDAPEGYLTEDYYTISNVTTEITLTSQIIADTDVSDVDYKLGSVMHDIVFTDTAGNTQKLSEVLQEKDMVVLNFWYTTCSWCTTEFPYMQSAYELYSDRVEIFALNPTDESLDDVSAYQQSMGLSMPMGMDDGGEVFNAFSQYYLEQGVDVGCPTSVIVDRYGVVCAIHQGALTSEEEFTTLFDAFVGDNYVQTLYTDGIEGMAPVILPDVEMPDADEIAAFLNNGGLNAQYHGEEGDEMSWPFVFTSKDGVDCMAPANTGVNNSYAILYADVELKAGQALALDYYASCETAADILYVLVDRNDIYQISGEDTGWNTCYPWVALEDGTYEIALCYLKDSTENVGDDTVYLKNLRAVDAADVEVASYIPRFAATNMRADGFGYETYITPVYNPADGYYHVNSADGPLLLANLLSASRFSNASIYDMAENGDIVVDGVNYRDALVPYCSYSSNSQIYSLCPVNEELKELLLKVTEAMGLEQTENEWLQICEYYDAYGTGGVQLGDPIQGLAAFSAYEAKLGTNTVTYDRILIPRGLLYKFVPTTSGAYRITSDSEFEVEGWVFVAEDLLYREVDGELMTRFQPYYTYEANERSYYSETNISMVLYMEAGKEYYIDMAYYDIYGAGTFTFDISYVSRELELFVTCSPGYYTSATDGSNDTIAGGIDVALGTDGYYHELLADGSLGSVIYADFNSPTNLFNSVSILEMLEGHAFNFALSENDQTVLDYYDYYEELNFNGTDFETCMKELWGESFDAYWEELQVDDVLDGIYHGDGEDMTAVVNKYVSKMVSSGDRKGCVAVNAELAEVLRMLADKFSLKGVENNWLKMCYYYDYIGSDTNK